MVKRASKRRNSAHSGRFVTIITKRWLRISRRGAGKCERASIRPSRRDARSKSSPYMYTTDYIQDAMDVDQSLPASGASTSGFAIGDTGGENQPTGGPSRSPQMASIFTQISLSRPLAESVIGREIGCTETLRSTRGYVDTVGSHSSCTSREGSPRGHIAYRCRGKKKSIPGAL